MLAAEASNFRGGGGTGIYFGDSFGDLVHAVMRFLTLYLIRIWIKMITLYSTTHTETGSEFVNKKSEKKSVKVTQKHKHMKTHRYIIINAVPFCGMALFINDKIPTKH